MLLIDKLFTLVIITFPIINQYSSYIHASIGFGDLILLLLTPLYLARLIKNRLVINDYIKFVIVTVLITCIDSFIIRSIAIDKMAIRTARDVFYGFIISMCIPKYFLWEWVKEFYKKLVFILSALILMQYFFYYVFDQYTFFILPFWKLSGGYGRMEVKQSMEAFSRYFYLRPTSLFLEPAMFGQYCIPGILVYLFDRGKSNKNIVYALFCSLGIVLSTSASGIAAAAVCWLVWFIYSWRKRAVNQKKLAGLFYAAAVTCCVVIFATSLGALLLSRVGEIGSSKGDTSGNYRVLRGFYIYNDLGPIQKISGVGLGNIPSYIKNNHVEIAIDDGSGDVEYMNSMSYLLVSLGAIGAIIFLRLLYLQFKRGNILARTMIIALIFLMMSCSIYNSSVWFLYMFIVLYSTGHKDRNPYKKEYQIDQLESKNC